MKILALFAVLTLGAAILQADEKSAVHDSPERRHAFELYDHFKMVEAMPLLQKLATENPNDIAVWERLGMAMLNYASSLDDPALAKLARAKARAIFLKAKEMGDTSNLVELFAEIPEDGGDVTFSPRAEVNKAMQQAEADFAKGDLDKAIEGYMIALSLDPKLYDAALFMGDVYFKQDKQNLAGEWFDRAIKINPDRETAYRYWGDSLVMAKKVKEARTKFIEAVIAEPYARRSWVGITQWAEKIGEKLHHTPLHDPANTEVKGGNLKMNLDTMNKEGDPVAAAWLAYGVERALWQKEKFRKEFPGEPQYRFTSAEESDSLHTLAAVLAEQKSKGAISDTPPALTELMRVDEAGLLMPYVFLFRATESIAKDYPAYRARHRDTIRRYLNEYVVPRLE